MVMLGRMPLRVGLARGMWRPFPWEWSLDNHHARVPSPVRGAGGLFTPTSHICPPGSTPQRLPWELFLRGGGRRLWEGSGGRRSVFKWCPTPVHTMPFPFWGRCSVSLFPGMRLEGPCPVREWGGMGRNGRLKCRDNRDPARLSCQAGWFASATPSAVLLRGHCWQSGR